MASPYMNVSDRNLFVKQQQLQQIQHLQQQQQQQQQQTQQQQQQQYSMLHETQQQQQRTMASRFLSGTMHFPATYQQQQHSANNLSMNGNSSGFDARYLHSQQQLQQQLHANQQPQKIHLNGCTYGSINGSMSYNDTGGSVGSTAGSYYNSNGAPCGNMNSNYMSSYDQVGAAYNHTASGMNRNRYSPYAQGANNMYQLTSATQQLMPSNMCSYTARQAAHTQQQLQLQQHQQQQQQQQQIYQQQLRRSQAQYMYDAMNDNSSMPQFNNMHHSASYSPMQNANSFMSTVPAYNQQQQLEYPTQQEQRSYHQQSHLSLARPTPTLTPGFNNMPAGSGSLTQTQRPASVCAPLNHDAFLSHPQVHSHSSSSLASTPSTATQFAALQYATQQANFISSPAVAAASKLPTITPTIAPIIGATATAGTISALSAKPTLPNNTEPCQTPKVKCEHDLVPSPHAAALFSVNANSPNSVANPSSCLTTSPPLISASGTDSGLSSCSTGRHRSAESTQSTPVYTYSNEYPMSAGSSSGVSYNFSDGKEIEDIIKDKEETITTSSDTKSPTMTKKLFAMDLDRATTTTMAITKPSGTITTIEVKTTNTTITTAKTIITTTEIIPKNDNETIKNNDDPSPKVLSDQIVTNETDATENDIVKSETIDQDDLSEEDTADDLITDIKHTTIDESQEESNCPSSASLDCQPAESSDGQHKPTLSISSSKNSATDSASSTPPCASPIGEDSPMPLLSPTSKTQDVNGNFETKSSPAPSFSSFLSTLDNETKPNSPPDLPDLASNEEKSDSNLKSPQPLLSPQTTKSLTPLLMSPKTVATETNSTNKILDTPSPATTVTSALNEGSLDQNDELETTILKNEETKDINEFLEKELQDESTPLPAFQQAFGSTEIGRFSETFGEHHVPNDIGISCESFDAALNEVFFSHNAVYGSGANNIGGSYSNSSSAWSLLQQQTQQPQIQSTTMPQQLNASQYQHQSQQQRAFFQDLQQQQQQQQQFSQQNFQQLQQQQQNFQQQPQIQCASSAHSNDVTTRTRNNFNQVSCNGF